jgi:polyphenol oxidase
MSKPMIQASNLASQTEIFHFFGTKETPINLAGLMFHANYSNNIQLVLPQQSHGKLVGLVTKENQYDAFNQTDALICNTKGIMVAVKTADCVPILLFDPCTKAVAAIHSGWRSTAQNIVGETICQLGVQFGCKPENLIAAIGPCISGTHYEVGADVAANFNKPEFKDAVTYKDMPLQKALLDLRKIIYIQLRLAGLPEQQIEVSNLCTYSTPALFYSARRNGAATGRMISGIMIG